VVFVSVFVFVSVLSLLLSFKVVRFELLLLLLLLLLYKGADSEVMVEIKGVDEDAELRVGEGVLEGL